ncbi:MAG: amidophosphoribosyltransferase [Pseudomonadota bacterium]
MSQSVITVLLLIALVLPFVGALVLRMFARFLPSSATTLVAAIIAIVIVSAVLGLASIKIGSLRIGNVTLLLPVASVNRPVDVSSDILELDVEIQGSPTPYPEVTITPIPTMTATPTLEPTMTPMVEPTTELSEGEIISDTEVIIHLVATSGYRTLLDRLIDALKRVEGAYSLICLTTEGMIACRDPLGIRPLVMGKLGDTIIFASETVALDIVGAEFIRSVEPGELVVVHGSEIHSHKPFIPVSQRPCIFEHVYFSRPDSIVEGISVYSVRKAIGAELARENGVDVDYVIPVPDSGTPAAIGYAEAAKIPFELGIIRSHYVGRTFIQPGDGVRHLGVKLKHNANRNLVAGKKIVLIDDSIVRGTTSLKIVQMMREAGAAEVHMRIASPPTMNSCFYGVDTPERSKLLASRMDVEEMRQFIQADSLAFLSIDGLYRALGEDSRNKNQPQYCDACFTGDYPTTLTDHEEHESGDLILLGERKSA